MTQQEYEHKKRECWEEFSRANPSHKKSIFARKVFDFAFDRAFALGKQEKDSESQEILTCEKRKALYHFRMAEACKIGNNPESDYWIGYSKAIQELFGSKCLPDDTKDDTKDGTKEPKPAEPKHHKGEKVYYNGYVYEVEGLVGKNRYALKGLNFDLHEDMIDPYEPYTEPEEESRNLSQNIVDCDKMINNIFKDSFRNKRRLTIAAMIEPSLIANPDLWKQHRGYGQSHTFAKLSLEFADALIAECEKGGKND